MNIDWLRELCLSFPGATEQIQWGWFLADAIFCDFASGLIAQC